MSTTETPTPSDIAGLSERLEAMTAFAKELSDALLTARPLGGSECFVKRCGAYYADPYYFKGLIKCESDNRHEAMKDLARERKRALRAKQQRDEAVTVVKLGLDVVSEERGWGTYPRMEGSEIYIDADAFREAARDLIRRLASVPEGGSEGEK